MKSNDLRKLFLDYFAERGHKIVPSSSLIPRNDPTLLFTNAGMVQFKGVFLGQEKRDYKRAVTSQKCMRAGGKHNDLENVGHTARHHTFFEMLGNFSFGDYFKKEAIAYGWEFLIKGVKLPKEKLWVTIYKDDNEAFDLWRTTTDVSPDRIVRLGEKDNFWQMGDTGPCGPCSEIIIDQGEEMSCGPNCRVGCDCDRYLEIWNLVFMQYNRDETGKLTPLPKPSIDTGMGLERLAAVVQGVKSNFETDLFQPLIGQIAKLAGVPYHKDRQANISYQVIADHLRAVTFLVSDGVLPSNEGRGYVLRRVIRRASRYGKLIGIEKPFLYRLTGGVVDEMKQAYPELVDSRDHVAKITLLEEERFAATLDSGLALLNEAVSKLKLQGKNVIPGEVLFKLYDTFGFPLDLAADMARDMELALDEAGYHRAMEEQRAKARSTWVGAGAEKKVKPVYTELAEKVQKPVFTGYDTIEDNGEIRAIVKADSIISAAHEGDEIEILLDRTPFYAESGGQVGDTGEIVGEAATFEVTNTIKPTEDLIVQKGRVKKGTFRTGDAVLAKVNEEKRADIARHHTVTHILHATLRSVLGEHVKQSGSLVAADRLRFDFTHYTALTDRERERVEALVNERIIENHSVETQVMDVEAATATGAMALFDEKYGDQVRVITVKDVSKELCGGTHTRASGDIGVFKILSESGIAAGVRRIEAVAGRHAYQTFKREEQQLSDIAQILKASDADLVPRVEKLLENFKALEKELERAKQKVQSSQAGDLASGARQIDGTHVLAKRIDGMDPKELRDFGDKLKDRIGSGILALGSVKDEKVSLIVMVTKDLTTRYHAGTIIKDLAAILGGTGGGRPELAQSGGKDPAKLDAALDRLYTIIGNK